MGQGGPAAIRSMVTSVLASLEGEAHSEVERNLAKLGHWLYHHTISEDLHGYFRDLGPKLRRLQLISEEPWIPWELLKPTDLEGTDLQSDFLCARLETTRWLGSSRRAANQLQAKEWTCVSEDGSSDRQPLEGWASDGGFREVELEEPTVAAVLSLLDCGGSDLWHFAIRGQAPNHSNEVVPLLLGGSATLGSHHLFDLDPENRRRPLVFLNTHDSARLRLVMDKLEGWPAAWIRHARCGALVAPSWRVNDRAAQLFAQYFYDGLRAGKTLGRTTLDARRRLRAEQRGATWLAYVVYGDPNAYLKGS